MAGRDKGAMQVDDDNLQLRAGCRSLCHMRTSPIQALALRQHIISAPFQAMSNHRDCSSEHCLSPPPATHPQFKTAPTKLIH